MTRLILLLPFAAALLNAQSLPMQFRLGSALVEPNSVIAFPETAVSSTSAVTLSVTNTSADTWHITQATTVGAGFAASSGSLTLGSGESRGVIVSVTPRQQGTVTGVLTLQFAGPANRTGTTSFNLSAAAGSTGLLLKGAIGSATPAIITGSLQIPAMLVGAREVANFVLTNQSAAAVEVADVAVAGDRFTLFNVPALPASISPGGEMRFGITFVPAEARSYSGRLTITAAGSARAVDLEGQGATSAFSYQLLTATASSPLAGGESIRFNTLAAGVGRQNLAIRVNNSGMAEGRVSAISVVGAHFSITDLPPLPATLKQGESFTFTVVFAPTEVGTFEGRLRVDADLFMLQGEGNGEKIQTTLVVGETRTPMGGPVIGFLPNTMVGEKLTFQVEIANLGTEASSVSAVQVSGDGYSTGSLPPLPIRLEPGQSFRFNATFTPSIVGTVSGVLQVQDKTYPIRGIGAAPPELPPVRFTGFAATGVPLQQPAIAIELERAYPYNLSGRLTLAFLSDAYMDDPAVQFLNGARAIEFRIPAGATRAVFGVSAQEIRLQTGSLAGAITLTSSFFVNTYELTKGNQPTATMALSPTVPVVRSVKIGARTATSFELVISGASNTRSVSKLDFEFTPPAGRSTPPLKLAATVEKDFDTWFQSQASRGLGGQFSAVIRFTLSGSLNAFESVTVIATNTQGKSTPRILKLNE